MRRTAGCLVAAGVLLCAAAPGSGQRPDGAVVEREGGATELERLRQAGEYEAAGNLAAATEVVREVLQDNASSLTALLAYERLLNVQGRPADVLPAVERLLRAEPASIIAHQVRLRVMAQLDDPVRIDSAVKAWVRATPQLETPYREAALVWRQRGETNRAVSILEQGRRSIAQADALALELGDAHAEAGDMQRAASEWARAVGDEGRGFLLVQRRLQVQSDAGARAIPYLVDQLSGPPQTPGRRRAAALFAIDAGLEPRAQRLASELAGQSGAGEREQILVEMARRADGAGLYRLAAWSYTELLRDARMTGGDLAIRTRVAELALLAGDTALAAQVYRELESVASSGSPQRREAMALRLRLTMQDDDLDTSAAEFELFRDEFPHAPELDETAAQLAVRHLDAGDSAGAERVLAGVTGPHSARVRGRIFIRAGDITRARDALLSAAPLLQGREATETIALAALLSRVSPAGGELVVMVVGAAPAERVDLLAGAADATRRLPPAERAAVLDFLASMADAAGHGDEADRLRREIVARLPATNEAPAALLALARRTARDGRAGDAGAGGVAAGGVEEARVLLERLILEYPRSALAPQARRELERLEGRSERR